MRRDRDCLTRFRRQVDEIKLLDTAELDTVDREVAALIDEAVAAARAALQPALETLTTDVYVRDL